MKYSHSTALVAAAGTLAMCLPTTTAFIAPASASHLCAASRPSLTRIGSIQLPTSNDGSMVEQPAASFSEAASLSEPSFLGEVVAPEGSRKGGVKGPAPKVVIEGDSLEGTWQQRAIVGSGFALSTIAVLQALASMSLEDPTSVAAVVATTAFSVVFSDFFSGVFHWSVDNYGDGRTPVLGAVIAAFQGHHEAPWTITYRPFENNVHKISAVTIPAVMAIVALHPTPLLAIFLVLFLNLQVLSQEFHKMSHMTKPPQWAQTLQDAGLIISRREHGQHHSSPFEGNYCILTGMCNEFLDRSGFFRRLEAVVYRATGAEPNCWKLGPEVKQAALSLE